MGGYITSDKGIIFLRLNNMSGYVVQNYCSFLYLYLLTSNQLSAFSVLQQRRHFSAVACEGLLYAVGGWYLDSLVTPDSSTAMYTAVELYDPWEDTWRFGLL